MAEALDFFTQYIFNLYMTERTEEMAKRGSVFDSALWAGRDTRKEIERAYRAQNEAFAERTSENIVIERERDSGKVVVSTPVAPAAPPAPLKYSPTPADLSVPDLTALREYAELCASIGVSGPMIEIEDFKVWLAEKDWPVYDLKTVIEFMDAKAKAEGRGNGWCWKPLRLKDSTMLHGVSIGTPARQRENWGADRWLDPFTGNFTDKPGTIPASNHLASNINVYTLPVPAHALRKVKAIEDSSFAGKVAFFVSDYAPAPAFKPDPFLLALIPNSEAAKGQGLFVIDVWEEPGFGLEAMLKG